MVVFSDHRGGFSFIARNEDDAKNIFEQENNATPHIKVIAGSAYLIQGADDCGTKMTIDSALQKLAAI